MIKAPFKTGLAGQGFHPIQPVFAAGINFLLETA
jgi:hypothetical protein